jgi:O-methyltransferase
MATDDSLYLDLLKKCLCASLYDESAWYVFQEGGQRNTQAKRNRRPVRDFIRSRVLRSLAKRSMILVKRFPYNPKSREIGVDWPCFGYTMIGLRRLDNLQFCVEDVLERNVPGDLIETGVWRGGSVILMRAILKIHGVEDRIVRAADSFEGMPVPDAKTYPADAGADLSDFEILRASLEQVQANFSRFGLLDDQVRLLRGWFRETFPSAPIERLAILRLDGDLYESTLVALNALYPRVSLGGGTSSSMTTVGPHATTRSVTTVLNTASTRRSRTSTGSRSTGKYPELHSVRRSRGRATPSSSRHFLRQ